MKAVNVGLLGLGTVGSGTLQVLLSNAQEISARAGREIRIVTAAVRDITRTRAVDTSSITLTTDPFAIVSDPQIDIVVEALGGEDVAKDAVLQAIANGKHVVTANKALIALHGNTIFHEAQKRGVTVAFEAAVAGGIPIIKALREGLAANRIEWLAGIINGTSNYIISMMEQSGSDFDHALHQAQALGYAEADPKFDIEGFDAAHKLTILAAIAFGIPLQFSSVYVQGIAAITSQDIVFARELGFAIKPIGLARRTADGIEMRVHPTLIPQQCLLANVDGVMNAVLVQADAVGTTLYYGAGAGAKPTASAVVADLVDVVRTITADPKNRVPHLAFQPDLLAALPILPIAQVQTAYYIRLTALNRPGVLAAITKIFGDSDISIETVLQKSCPQSKASSQQSVTVIMLTQKTRERNFNSALQKLTKLASVGDEIMHIRLENLS